MNRHDWLLELARSVSPDQAVSVPAGWLLEALGPSAATANMTVDLTVAEVAARFGRKSTSTVRVWCEKGLLPGAYRLHGREWRVPMAALEALQERHREKACRRHSEVMPEVSAGNLSDWRKHRKPAA